MEEDPESAYRAPELCRRALVGLVFGGIKDGKKIRTSSVVSIDPDNPHLVTTESGNQYLLGKPEPEWLAWMIKTGIKFDPEHPVRMGR